MEKKIQIRFGENVDLLYGDLVVIYHSKNDYSLYICVNRSLGRVYTFENIIEHCSFKEVNKLVNEEKEKGNGRNARLIDEQDMEREN